MSTIDLTAWAHEIAQQQGFKINSLLYQATHRHIDQPRNIIFDGVFKNKRAILKTYNDRRISHEPEMQRLFRERYSSKHITAPEVYASAILSPHRGWLIMERLPDNGHFFKPPLASTERKKFLELFIDYREHFPRQMPHSIMPFEKLPAPLFTRTRIDRWFVMASEAEAELMFQGKPPLLQSPKFMTRFQKALIFLDQALKNKPMIWCHGHFKPQELYYHPAENTYYLTDFGHVHLYPEGYELGFMAWADWIMAADWKLPYASWRQGIDVWITDLLPVADTVGVANPQLTVIASLVERCLGALLADVVAADKPREQKEAMIALLYRLLDELMS